jgi:hypothetical protein
MALYLGLFNGRKPAVALRAMAGQERRKIRKILMALASGFLMAANQPSLFELWWVKKFAKF